MGFDYFVLTELMLALGALSVVSSAYVTLKETSRFCDTLEAENTWLYKHLGEPEPYGDGPRRSAAWRICSSKVNLSEFDESFRPQVMNLRSFYRMTYLITILVISYSLLAVPWIILGGQRIMEETMEQQFPALEEVDNECISNLSVLEDKFGLSREGVFVLKSSCTTCAPWYQPQVESFEANIIDENEKEHWIMYYDNCPRHGHGVTKICFNSSVETQVYGVLKNKVCGDIQGISGADVKKCLAGMFEESWGQNTYMSFEVHHAGTPVEERPYIEWNFTGVTDIGSSDCYLGWVPDYTLGRPVEWDAV